MEVLISNDNIRYESIAHFEFWLKERAPMLEIIDLKSVYGGQQSKNKLKLLEHKDSIKLTDDAYVLSDNQIIQQANKSALFQVYNDFAMFSLLIKNIDIESLHKWVEKIIFLSNKITVESEIKFGLITSCSILQLQFPICRPPKNLYSGTNCFLDIFNINEAVSEEDNVFIEKLLKLKPPNYVHVSRVNDVLFLNWIAGANTEEEIANRLSLRYQWYYENFDDLIDTDFNELGDKQVYLWAPITLDLFTFYYDNIGYKASYFNNENDYDSDLINQLIEIKKVGKVGEYVIEKIFIILPTREQANKFNLFIKDLGLDGIVYMDNEGKLWNPFPFGNWIICHV